MTTLSTPTRDLINVRRIRCGGDLHPLQWHASRTARIGCTPGKVAIVLQPENGDKTHSILMMTFTRKCVAT